MSTPKVRGGFTVTGSVTGGYLIRDIKVSVPHGVTVFISADQAYKSKDLWAGIQQGKIFPLTGPGLLVERAQSVRPQAPAAPPAPSTAVKESQSNEALKSTVEAMKKQLDEIQGALSQMAIVAAAPQPSPAKKAPEVVEEEDTGVVGGEIPAFIPDDLKPKDAKSNIKVETETSNTSVNDTVKMLRKARKARKGKS